MSEKADRWEAAVIKEEDLVCKVGDRLKLIAYLDLIDNDTDKRLDMLPAGQIYKAEGRKGAGWDLVRMTGDGPPELRIYNWDILDFFEILPSG